MEIIEQLWLLKQIYSYENRGYDLENKTLVYRIPENISSEDVDALKKAGHFPNDFFKISHDEVMDDFYRLAETWTLKEASDVFIAGLWSEPFLWQNALTAKVIALAMPRHEHTPYSSHSSMTCGICGYQNKIIDVTNKWYYSMISGTAVDGEPMSQVLALREMQKMGRRPKPNAYDLWTFRAILTVIRSMPPKTRYSKVRDALHKEKLLPTKEKWVYGKLLEAFALIGILDTKEYPGMTTQFTTYKKRDERPRKGSEAQAPLAWWNTSVGINEETLEKLFPAVDCSPVDLTVRPASEPSLSETITGQLEKRRRNKRKFD